MSTVLELSNKQEILNKRERSGEKVRVEIQFHQPNKIVNGLIQSDHLQMAANEGIRQTYDPRSQDITEPEAFFPITTNTVIVHAAELAVLELCKQPEGSRRCIVANLNARWNLSAFQAMVKSEYLSYNFQLVLSRRKSDFNVGKFFRPFIGYCSCRVK